MGQVWWDVILDRVRSSDLFVCAVSPSMLASVACTAELDYAARLGKPPLPVVVAPTAPELLPSALAVLQTVNFTQDAPDAALRLAGAILGLPAAPGLPAVLPPPPPEPVSYLSGLAERARAPQLSADEQLAMVVRLEEAWARPGERAVANQVSRLLLERDDLLHLVALRLQVVLDGPGPAAPQQAAGPNVDRLGWRVEVSRSQGRERIVRLHRGDRSWLVDYKWNSSGGTVFVDGRRVRWRQASPPRSVPSSGLSTEFDLVWDGVPTATVVSPRAA